ncbi:MAG: DUF5011 domain-containing protein [Candidatus Peribacteria bacterium]|nr:DUF5011 domain-containing protein [Candidatus Peribacteria bacterium]
MLFQQFKQWSLKSLVSVIIFVSVVLLGGTIITLALPSSLDAVKSINANNQLTAQNRDYLVDKVKSTISDISTVNSRINTLSGTAASNYTDLTNRITTVSGNVNTNTTAISTLTIRVNTLSESTSTNTTTITNLTNLLNALNNTISNQAGDSIPAGAVMAFDLSACPSGWTRFADADNRFIMGANTNSKEKGGNSSITLAWNQLPPHSHYVEDTAYLENGRAVLNLERGASNGYYRNDWQLP